MLSKNFTAESKTLIVSQARMTSTRLPGKILLPAKGVTLLETHIRRLQKANLPIVVATTTNQTDDVVENLCQRLKVSVTRGSEFDVLERYYLAAKKHNAQHIIRVTSDCPLIDGELIRASWEKYISLADQNAYVSNVVERTFPRGFDFEIFSFSALEKAYTESKEISEREHVTPYIRKHSSTFFWNVTRTPDASQFRITVDEPDDFRLMKVLIEDFHADQLSAEEIISLLNENPALSEINRHVEQKKI